MPELMYVDMRQLRRMVETVQNLENRAVKITIPQTFGEDSEMLAENLFYHRVLINKFVVSFISTFLYHWVPINKIVIFVQMPKAIPYLILHTQGCIKCAMCAAQPREDVPIVMAAR